LRNESKKKLHFLPQSFNLCHEMQLEERQAKIEAYLQEAEFASLEELAQRVGRSVSTVRRDLVKLERSGKARRTHGGARTLQPKSDEFVFNVRDTREVEEKEAIGAACASLIQPGQTVIIDGGTTCYHVARHLSEKVAQVITDSLPVANLFSSSSRHEVLVSGGTIYPRLGVLVGPHAVETFSRVHADVAILGGSGICEEGIYNSHALLVDIQRAMMAGAARVIFCLDHAKFNRRSTFFLTNFEPVDTVVTDAQAPEALIDHLRKQGIEVMVAPAGTGAPIPPK
jgi:DeoR/GlpR family transcriptional regulator of sugar metabolism